MNLRTRISTELKEAMKAKDAGRLSTLRLINAAIKDRDIAKRGEGDAEGDVASDAEITAILGKMVKQREESSKLYTEGGRKELADQETEEMAIIREFMPEQMDDEQIAAMVDELIAETDAQSLRDMGKVMARIENEAQGRADLQYVLAAARDIGDAIEQGDGPTGSGTEDRRGKLQEQPLRKKQTRQKH